MPHHQAELAAFGTRYWTFYRDLLAYQRAPTVAGDRLLISAASIVGCVDPSAEGLLADRAPVALALATVDADVALPDVPSCGAVHIRAECRQRIDGTPPFGLKHRKCAAIRSDFQVQSLTTV
jgi:hypothetical protein